MTVPNTATGDWVVELIKTTPAGTTRFSIYGYTTEQEAKQAVQGWMTRLPEYREGTTRRRRAEEEEKR